MKIAKFKIIQFIRDLILTIDKQMDNFPKKDIELKNRIRSNSYDILELAYEANCMENIERKKELLQKMVAKIKIVDFLLNLSYDKQIIPQKKYFKFGDKKPLIDWFIDNKEKGNEQIDTDLQVS